MEKEILNNIYKELSLKEILFKRGNKIVSKTKLNISFLKTKNNYYVKVFSYSLKMNVLVYDFNDNKNIKTGEFGITNNLKTGKSRKYYIHCKNTKEEIISVEDFNKFIYKK